MFRMPVGEQAEQVGAKQPKHLGSVSCLLGHEKDAWSILLKISRETFEKASFGGV